MSFALPITDCQRCPLGISAAPALCPFVREQRAAGRHLAFKGGPVEMVAFVKRGYVSLATSKRELESVRGPGAVVGFECLTPRAATHTVTTLTDAEVCTLPVEAFKTFSTARPLAILALLAAELTQRDIEASFRTGRAQVRVARFMLERLRSGGAAYPLPFQNQALARFLGLRPETLSRTLKQLRRDGVLFEGADIFVRDASALAECALGKKLSDQSIVART